MHTVKVGDSCANPQFLQFLPWRSIKKRQSEHNTTNVDTQQPHTSLNWHSDAPFLLFFTSDICSDVKKSKHWTSGGSSTWSIHSFICWLTNKSSVLKLIQDNNSNKKNDNKEETITTITTTIITTSNNCGNRCNKQEAQLPPRVKGMKNRRRRGDNEEV